MPASTGSVFNNMDKNDKNVTEHLHIMIINWFCTYLFG